jgi:predicted RNase H-like HicB family nuclease
MKKYLIVIEKTDSGYSSYSPDLPGCMSTGKSREEAEKNMREAIEFNVESLRQEGYPVPEPQASSSYIELPA